MPQKFQFSFFCSTETWINIDYMKMITDYGKTETVKFDKAKQQERVELHTGYELTAVSLDEQYNYVALYQIQQYDE